MPERSGRVRGSKVLTLSLDERGFGRSKGRFGMIPGRDIKVMIRRHAKVQVSFVSSLSISDSMRTSMIKSRVCSMSRESMWNECLHSRDYHLSEALRDPCRGSSNHSMGNQ